MTFSILEDLKKAAERSRQRQLKRLQQVKTIEELSMNERNGVSYKNKRNMQNKGLWLGKKRNDKYRNAIGEEEKSLKSKLYVKKREGEFREGFLRFESL